MARRGPAGRSEGVAGTKGLYGVRLAVTGNDSSPTGLVRGRPYKSSLWALSY